MNSAAFVTVCGREQQGVGDPSFNPTAYCRCVQQKLEAAALGNKRANDKLSGVAQRTAVNPCIAVGRSTPFIQSKQPVSASVRNVLALRCQARSLASIGEDRVNVLPTGSEAAPLHGAALNQAVVRAHIVYADLSRITGVMARALEKSHASSTPDRSAISNTLDDLHSVQQDVHQVLNELAAHDYLNASDSAVNAEEGVEGVAGDAVSFGRLPLCAGQTLP